MAIALRLAGMPEPAVLEQHERAITGVTDIVAVRRASWVAKGEDVAYFDAMNSAADVALAHTLRWIDAHYDDVSDHLRKHGAPDAIAEEAALSLAV